MIILIFSEFSRIVSLVDDAYFSRMDTSTKLRYIQLNDSGGEGSQ